MIRALIKKINNYNNTTLDVMYLECSSLHMLQDIIYYTKAHLEILDITLEVELI